MKVLRLHAKNQFQLHDEDPPGPSNGEEMVRVTSVGICGSDLHWLEGGGIGADRLERPLVLGHEFAGVIANGKREGTAVAVDPAVPCLRCEFCLEGHPNLCTNVRFSGHAETDGALREAMAWPSHCLFPLPEGFSADDGAMLEPLGVAIHAIDLAKVGPAATVGVFGSGPIGLLVMQVARAAGATRIFATDIRPHRLDAAAEAGATDTIAADGSEAKQILEATGGRGVDVAFEAAGTNEAVEAAIDASRPGARVLLIGIPSDDRTSFTASAARRKGLTLMLARRMKHVYPRAIELVRSGRVDVRSMVSHQFGLEDYAEAFDVALHRQGLKVMIHPTDV